MTREEIKDRDLLFCELLFELGSVTEASDQLGITKRQGRKIHERNKDLLLSMIDAELATSGYKAVATMRAALEADHETPKGELRLKAASEILDRVGAAKKTQQELEIKVETPVILMPAKDTTQTPVIKVTATDED